MANFGPLTTEIGSEFETAQQISTGFASWQCYSCGVEQRVSPIFGRVTITLGIGPHSSFDFVFSVLVKRLVRNSISEMIFFVEWDVKP